MQDKLMQEVRDLSRDTERTMAERKLMAEFHSQFPDNREGRRAAARALNKRGRGYTT